ncbi:hypothetical protein EJB05_49682, partial [Eragrostis curvula]
METHSPLFRHIRGLKRLPQPRGRMSGKLRTWEDSPIFPCSSQQISHLLHCPWLCLRPRGSSESGPGEIDVQSVLSSLNADLQDVGPLCSIAQRLQLPKVELGLSNFDSDVLFRSLIALQIKSITLTHSYAHRSQHLDNDASRESALEASLAMKEEALIVSSSAVSELERETATLRSTVSGQGPYLSFLEKTVRDKKLLLEKEQLFRNFLSTRLSDLIQSKTLLSDNSYAKSLRFCGLLKELVQLVGASYDNLSEEAYLESVKEWLDVNIKGLVEMESLWDRLPRGVVKVLIRNGLKRGDNLPQELVDHFTELDKIAEKHSLVAAPRNLFLLRGKSLVNKQIGARIKFYLGSLAMSSIGGKILRE